MHVELLTQTNLKSFFSMSIVRLKYAGINIFNNLVHDLPVSKKISYKWNYGSLLGLFLVVQILRGFILRTKYIAKIESAYFCVDKLNRDILFAGFRRVAHGKFFKKKKKYMKKKFF